ncbi:MAG: superoxide dismutase family protein, partial [Bacteroidota bacterium]|nr:superoxide dismutase family protein [Bacteroidota bacterium]
HEFGDCSSIDAKSAGGHWNPDNHKHGKWGTESHHKGDIANLFADSSGRSSLKFETDLWCLDCDDESKNILNKSLIIHQGPDDFHSQPSGNAGKRIACGVINLN